MRDDFSKKTIDIISKQSGYICSNPLCRKLTYYYTDKSICIGVAAHITAASQNGPRFCKEMTVEQRSSYENGIWLCQSCAKLIDSDVYYYNIELLNNWKNIAKNYAANQINHKAILDEKLIVVKTELFQAYFRTDPGYGWIVPWRGGDLYINFSLRVMNNLDYEDIIHSFKINFYTNDVLTFSDVYAIQEVVLLSKKWATIPVDYNLSKEGFGHKGLNSSSVVYLEAETTNIGLIKTICGDLRNLIF